MKKITLTLIISIITILAFGGYPRKVGQLSDTFKSV